jgi:hypothetical protein
VRRRHKTRPFAFHASGCAPSVAAVFAIFNRYFSRGSTLLPQEIDVKPNYQLGPIKLATVLAIFWASPDSWSDFGWRWGSPGRHSISIWRSPISAGYWCEAPHPRPFSPCTIQARGVHFGQCRVISTGQPLFLVKQHVGPKLAGRLQQLDPTLRVSLRDVLGPYKPEALAKYEERLRKVGLPERIAACKHQRRGSAEQE